MSTRLARVREIWDAMSRDLFEGSEVLFTMASPDCVFRPAFDHEREFSADQLRVRLRAISASGTQVQIRAQTIVEIEAEDSITVEGDMRVRGADGSFADSTIHWVCHFDDADRIVRAASW